MKEYKNVIIKMASAKKMSPEIEEIFNNYAIEGWKYCTKFITSATHTHIVVFEREK